VATPRANDNGYDPVRAWHLVQSDRDEALTAFEFTLLQVEEAFQRWCVQIARLVGNPEITFNEVVVLHVVRMQERAKDAATIAKLVNRDDLPNVQYNLRKLVSLGLVEKVRLGAGSFFQVTELGRDETDRYAELRHRILTESLEEVASSDQKFAQVNRFLQVMTGIYDSAARATAVINPTLFFDPARDAAATEEDKPAKSNAPAQSRPAPVRRRRNTSP
jgi:predicted MarR family transcription regulator